MEKKKTFKKTKVYTRPEAYNSSKRIIYPQYVCECVLKSL